MFRRFKIRKFEIGLLFRDREFVGLLHEGKHWRFDPGLKLRLRIVSTRDPWLADEQLDVIVKSGCLEGHAEVIDLKDDSRALVWVDGRFSRILGPGMYAYWTQSREVRVELVDATEVRFQHKELKTIARSADAPRLLDECKVNRDCVGVLFIDGRYVDQLKPGLYAFWRDVADSRVVELDLRESVLDISGQDIMTADKVTLRMNAVVSYVIDDPRKAMSVSTDARQALYREVQLALRSIVGARDLDSFLSEKNGTAEELEADVQNRAAVLGLRVASVGIKDVILPGDMKDLMNKVTEARKAAEANLIARREETAAIRSQANTAKLLTDNPTLMRLRELEVLEKVATSGNMNIVLGEKGLADRVVNLL